MKFFLLKFYLLTSISLFVMACKSEDKNKDDVDPTLANKQALGTSSSGLLASTEFKKLVVEFAYSDGFRPRQETLDLLLIFLQERLNKPNGIEIIETIIPFQGSNSVTIQRIREIEDQYRTTYNLGETISVFIHFSSQNSSNDTSNTVTLGSAHRNTSIVIYDKTLRTLAANGNVELSVLQSNTVHHEFGHLFSLVNISLDDIHGIGEHEDSNNSKHCFVETCLMYFQSSGGRETIVKTLNKRANSIGFDPLCLADLQAKGGK